jgi:hypothetical protein
MKLSFIIPLMLLPTVALANVPGEKPDVLLGTTDNDNRFYLPLTLVRNESITLNVQVETNVRGDAIACRLLSDDVLLASDNGRECHLSAQGFGLRHYVLQVVNLDATRGHQVYITANRGRSHHG